MNLNRLFQGFLLITVIGTAVSAVIDQFRPSTPLKAGHETANIISVTTYTGEKPPDEAPRTTTTTSKPSTPKPTAPRPTAPKPTAPKPTTPQHNSQSPWQSGRPGRPSMFGNNWPSFGSFRPSFNNFPQQRPSWGMRPHLGFGGSNSFWNRPQFFRSSSSISSSDDSDDDVNDIINALNVLDM